MDARLANSRASYVTLAATTVLHAFTHAYGVLLVPLYLLMVRDLSLPGIKRASLIVTVYGLVYNLGSYPAGILADRFDRKWLLGLGLVGNGLAIAAMGLTKQYELLILLGVIAGLCGTLFHPSANALIPAHYPRNPGMAIGLLGVGSGLGFFMGPQFAGWRAQSAVWQFDHVSNWQRPCIEMGLAGAAVGILFLIVAREVRSRGGRIIHGTDKATLPERIAMESIVLDYSAKDRRDDGGLSRAMIHRVLAVASVLSFRDFAGIACISLTSLYLQKAHGFDAKQAGLIVGGMMLLGVIANPLAVFITPGRRRLRGLVSVLIVGALFIATVPLWPARAVLVPLMCFQALQFGSYAISDAAMLERVSPRIRGRVVGLFLTIAGTFAAMSPFAMGYWVDILGARATEPLAYLPPYLTLAAMMIAASGAAPLIARLGATPAREPETVGAVA